MAVAVAATACGKKKEPEPPTPVTTNPVPTTTRDTVAERVARERADSVARAEEARRAAAAATAEARNTLTEMVFFDYDASDIRSDMQEILNRKAALLRANPNVTLRIEGHADERGTVEYNLALSLRRANVVRDYLTGFGIDASRLEVNGYGEEQLLEQNAATESMHARNRRAEFEITRGGDILVLR
jgi:peptidoglycan-associated lipoprotein